MKTVNVTITGVTPLLQSRFTEEAERPMATRTILQDRGTPRDQAEKAVMRDNKGAFYFPGTWIQGSIREAGGNHKVRGSRKSVKFVVGAAVTVVDIAIPLRNGDGHSLIKDFEVDSRPVVIPATKGRVMRHRPRFDNWSAEFTLELDEEVLPEDFVHQLLNEAGQRQGIGDFRPNKTGPFGKFRVTKWKPTS